MPQLRIKPTMGRKVTPAGQRYFARWINGVWTIFDIVKFMHGLPLPTQKEAFRIANGLNDGSIRWAAA